jgi:hypothetical protein
MLNRLFVLGVAAAVFSLASPCQAAPAVESDANTFGDLEVGAPSGIIALDQFNPDGILPNGDPVGELQGVLLYLRVHLKRGRLVLDNENEGELLVTVRKLWIGGTLGVVNEDLNVHYEASPLKQVPENTVILAKDVNIDGTDLHDGQWPDTGLGDAVLDLYSDPADHDKLAVIIRPDDPLYSFEYTHTYTTAADLAIFTGTGEVSFEYGSLLEQGYDVGGQDVNAWSVPLTFDIEAQVIYLYAGVPEPASMGLLAAAFVPVLARRLRKRKTRLS